MNKLNNKIINKFNKLKLFNVVVDEDGFVGELEESNVVEYKWKGYISKDGMCDVVEWNLEEDGVSGVDEYVKSFMGGINREWKFEKEVGEKEKLLKGVEILKELLFSCGGVLISWSVEYDWNLCVVLKELFDEDGEVINESEYYDDGELGMEWYNREVDESEFDGI